MFPKHLIRTKPMAERESILQVADLPRLTCSDSTPPASGILELSRAIREAKRLGKPVIFFIGGHVIKTGMGVFISAMIREGWVDCVAGNGATMIHDWELATFGATSESVPYYLAAGQFGMWRELAELNALAGIARCRVMGWGECVGQWLAEHGKHLEHSVLYNAWSRDVPFTTHALIGGDISHQLPSANGCDIGGASYNDFLIFADRVYRLHGGGVFVTFGSSVHAPEIFLKALSMSRNVAARRQEIITDFTTVVCDMYPLGEQWRTVKFTDLDPEYYYRPWKTILLRTIAEGGRSYYLSGLHQQIIPSLWSCLSKQDGMENHK